MTDTETDIPPKSMWRHQISGNRFIVWNTDPGNAPKGSPAYLPNPSESFVLVEAPDYETRDRVYLAARLFDSQLTRID